jgi:hypothetical protein
MFLIDLKIRIQMSAHVSMTRISLIPVVYAMRYPGAASLLFVLIAGLVMYRYRRTMHEAECS